MKGHNFKVSRKQTPFAKKWDLRKEIAHIVRYRRTVHRKLKTRLEPPLNIDYYADR